MTTWHMPADRERVHRWLTEAELQEMLDKAREDGRKAANEKLRALLVEARPVLHAHATVDSWSIRDRIDAALAEPVEECVNCEIEIKARCLAQQERDEARAEVERLEVLSVKREVMLDKLRWVSQEARAAIMLGYTGPNHETLRKALAQLTVTEEKP